MPKPPKSTGPTGVDIANELGIHKDVVYWRVSKGLTLAEIRLLGAPPPDICNRRDLRDASKASGVSRDMLLYRVAVLGWTLEEAEKHGSAPNPPPSATSPRLWGERRKETPLPPPPRPKFVPPPAAPRAGGTSFKLTRPKQ